MKEFFKKTFIKRNLINLILLFVFIAVHAAINLHLLGISKILIGGG